MSLKDIESGSSVWVDANIFIYHCTDKSRECTGLLERCESGQIRGFTSALIVAEVCHRLMTIDALEQKLIAPGNAVRRLSERPDLVRQLGNYRNAVEDILLMGIEVTPVTGEMLVEALGAQRRYGLLTNDSLIVSSMLRSGVHLIATADRRFRAVREIDVATPSDLGPNQ